MYLRIFLCHLFRVMYLLCVCILCSFTIVSLHTVDVHKLSVCRFSILRRLGRFSSACIDSVGTCLVGLVFTPLRLHLPSFFVGALVFLIRRCLHDPHIDACAEVTVEVDHASVSSPSLSRPCVAETCFTPRRSH